jgi:2,3-dihydroxy-p-cumate/2,3-dihydroxybenzoate 3,4-dioxygenase
MALIEQLRYVWLETPDFVDACTYASDVIGLECGLRDDKAAYFRSDDRAYTLAFQRSARAAASIGLEVREPATLDAVAQSLRERGMTAERGDNALRALRRVKDILQIADPSGNAIELVVRPEHRGRRYFPSRDAGVVGFSGVTFDSINPERDAAWWCDALGARISDYVGDAVFLRLDDLHHRIALYPAKAPRLTSLSFEVEDFNNIMQNWYFLADRQVRILQGPGRQPFSGQIFLKFEGPNGSIFGYTHGMIRITETDKWCPRQFAAAASSACMWGTQAPESTFRLTL